jgi:hypothetical protein
MYSQCQSGGGWILGHLGVLNGNVRPGDVVAVVAPARSGWRR